MAQNGERLRLSKKQRSLIRLLMIATTISLLLAGSLSGASLDYGLFTVALLIYMWTVARKFRTDRTGENDEEDPTSEGR